MWLTLRNVSVQVTRATGHETQWLRSKESGLTFGNKRTLYKTGKVETVRFFDLLESNFPTGFLPQVLAKASVSHIQTDVIDGRKAPCVRQQADLSWLRDYQREAVEAGIVATRGIFHVPTGGGKCLGPTVPVLRYDGEIVPARDIRPGDRLMGPDSKPRTVLSITSGHGPMYRIIPIKGKDWSCNDVHILTLVHTETGEVIDITVHDYLQRSAYWKHCHKLFQPAQVDFETVEALPIDPYFVGIWYGDGRRSLRQGVQISKPDAEIEAACRDIARHWGLVVRVDRYKACPTYRIVSPSRQENLLTQAMRRELPPDQLPKKYLMASATDRAALLAGLLDTDGYLHNGCFEIVQERFGVASGIAFLARSLGFRVTERIKRVNGKPYARLSILGDATHIPLRITRKAPRPRKQKKNALRTGFHVSSLGEGFYVGFTLDGDGRFLLGDFTVTHNTEIAIGLIKSLPCRWLFLVHRKSLLSQAMERYQLRTGDKAGQIGEGRWTPGERLTVATFQTLAHALRTQQKGCAEFLALYDGVIIDECHVLPATSFNRVAMALTNAYWRFGISGTPLDREDQRSVYAVAALGPIIYTIRAQELIAEGRLAQPVIRMVDVHQDIREVDSRGFMTRWPWMKVYDRAVIGSVVRNRTLITAVQRADKPCLVFVKAIDHGKQFCHALKARGIRAEFVWGSSCLKTRQAAVRELLRGDFDVLISSVIFQEGIDIPELRSVVIASGGKGVIAALQRIGRGMRVVAGKSTFEVWDIADTGHPWLERHAKARRKAYQREGYKVLRVELVPSTPVPIPLPTISDEWGK